jgi:hypothetical protein
VQSSLGAAPPRHAGGCSLEWSLCLVYCPLVPIFSRFVLVTSSYSPLFILLGLVSYEKHWRLALTFWALAAVPVLLLVGLLIVMWRVIRTLPLEITSVRDRTEDVGVYATTYLLPFLALTFDDWETVVALFVFIGLLILVYLRARVSYLNPLLLVAGFRLFEIEYRTRRKPEETLLEQRELRRAVAISWRGLRDEQKIDAARIERPTAHLGVLLVKKVVP